MIMHLSACPHLLFPNIPGGEWAEGPEEGSALLRSGTAIATLAGTTAIRGVTR
jgi:hypothetical protein